MTRPAPGTRSPGPPVRRPLRAGRRWSRYLLYASAVLGIAVGGGFGYFYASYARLIDERLHGERARSLPLVYARPVELRRGQLLSEPELIARLNDLGYAERAQAGGPGEFARVENGVSLSPRTGDVSGRLVNITFPAAPAVRQASTPRPPARGVRTIEVAGSGRVDRVLLDAPLLTPLSSGAREKRRRVPLAAIPERMRHAVLAIEDQSFY